MSELHGFSRGDEFIYITYLPTHKKPVLLIRKGCVGHKIASFDSEEDAEVFCRMLEKWLGVDKTESKEKE